MSSKTPSSKRAFLQRELAQLPKSPPPVHLRMKTAEEDTLQVYCPQIRTRCGAMTCRSCTALPEGGWVCSSCAKPKTVRPFWAEGNCDECGEPSSFLLYVPR